MNNIYTEIGTLLDNHIDERFEISELVDSKMMSIIEKEGKVTWEGNVTEQEAVYIMQQYKFEELLPAIDGVDLTVLGYVEGREFFVFSVWQAGEETEMSPTRRANFMEFFNLNLVGVKLRHVPVLPQVLTLEGAKKALVKSKRADVERYTVKALVELCGGISPMTKRPKKGMVFKSMDSPFSFKVYSEQTLLGGLGMMGSV